ncbi:MAG: hypothetical protein AB2705_02710 [Candidatus Thiodiazotropha sp.]
MPAQTMPRKGRNDATRREAWILASRCGPPAWCGLSEGVETGC